MPTLVTDPELLRQLNAPDSPPQSATPATGQMDAQPGAPSGQMPDMTRVTDPALLQQLNASEAATPGVRFAPQGKPGANGLVWDKDGGRDPQTGELVMAGKPMSENAPSQGLAAASSALSGVPIVGPYLERGAVKAGAYLRDRFYGDPADQTESAVQGDIERSQAAYPKTTTAAGIAGGVVGMAPAVAAAPEMFGAGGGNLAGKVATGAFTGADIGGLDAAVRSDGDLRSVAYGSGGGAIGGTAGPVIGAGLSRAAHGIADLGARHFSPDPGMSRPAAQILARAAETDGTLSPEGLARLREGGPNAMLADSGPATAGVLDTAMQRGGPGATAARSAIEQRAAAADQDLSRALDDALGPEQGVHTAETAIRTGSAPARQSAYDAAYAQPIDYSKSSGRALEALVKNHIPAKAISQANALIRADPSAGPSRQIIAHVSADGSVTFERMPDVRQLDFITRGLNDVAAAENGKGKLGGTTQLGNVYGNLSKAIRAQLRQAVPEYANALETAAEPIAARNALKFGNEILNPSIPRDVAIETVSHMTVPELMQAKSGLRSQIAETLANVRRTIGDDNVDARQAMTAVKMLSSDAAREKMALIVGSGEAGRMAQNLEQELSKATRALELRSRVATNARTFGRAVTDQAIKEATTPGFVGKALEGKPIDAPRSILQALTARRPIDYARREDAVYGELADALTGPRGSAAEGMLERLIRMNDATSRANSVAGMIPFGPAAQTGLLALLPSINQLPHSHP